jgi:hypothetical protein
MRCAFALFLFLSAFAAGGFSQTPNKDKAQNLRNCVAGFGECDRSLLTSAQQKQIDALRHDHNLWDCLKAFGCDYSGLNELESEASRGDETAGKSPRLRIGARYLVINRCSPIPKSKRPRPLKKS